MLPEDAEAFLKRLEANRTWENDRPNFKASFWPSQQTHDARPFEESLYFLW